MYTVHRLLTYFIFSVVLVLLVGFSGLDANQATVGDIVRLVQSSAAQRFVIILTVILAAFDFAVWVAREGYSVPHWLMPKNAAIAFWNGTGKDKQKAVALQIAEIERVDRVGL